MTKERKKQCEFFMIAIKLCSGGGKRAGGGLEKEGRLCNGKSFPSLMTSCFSLFFTLNSIHSFIHSYIPVALLETIKT